jgi:hypothetical protein
VDVLSESPVSVAGSGSGAVTEKPRPDYRKIARALTESEFADGIRLTGQDIAQLEDIASGRVRRHAGSIVHAIRTKLEWGHAKPRQETELSGNVTIVVQSAVPVPMSARLVTVALPAPEGSAT